MMTLKFLVKLRSLSFLLLSGTYLIGSRHLYMTSKVHTRYWRGDYHLI